MTYPLSRVMSGATAAYAGYCFARPGHLGAAMGAGEDDEGYRLLAHVFGVRDGAVSLLGLTGRSPGAVRTAMLVRVLCDVGDGVVLARRAGDEATRGKVLGVTLSWAALNLAALAVDSRRAGRSAVRDGGWGEALVHDDLTP